jgi:MFS family permease
VVVTIVLDGTAYSFGVFLESLETDLSLSRSAVSTIYSVNMAIAAVAGLGAGLLLDKMGAGRILIFMALCTGAGLVLTGYVNSSWQIFLTYGLLLGVGDGPAYIVTNSIVMRAMPKREGLAVGLVNSGEGLGIIVMAPAATALIAALDWRRAYLVIGVLAVVCILPVALFVRRTPQEKVAEELGLRNAGKTEHQEPPASASIGDMAKTRSFWLFAVSGLALAATVALVFTHIVPHALDAGLTPRQAALVMTVVGIMSIVGAIGMGMVGDRIGLKRTAIICAVLLAVAVCLLLVSDSAWSLYAFGVLAGFAYMGSLTSLTALVGKIFGVANVGKVLGVRSIGVGLGGFLGPLVGGLVYDRRGSYDIGFIVCIALVALAAVLITQIRRETSAADQ